MADRMYDRKIIVIKRKSRLKELIYRFNTVEQARFYIEHMGSDFSDYVEEDKRYEEALTQVSTKLEQLGRVQVLDREFVPNFIFDTEDIVVAVGQDGLVANTMKYLNGQLLVGVNPDPVRWDGVLLPFRPFEAAEVVAECIKGNSRIQKVTMAKAELNDGQVIYGVNDLFIGQRTHVSSRYHITYGKREENQSSSGIIISTGLGSTGWLKSILKGAAGIVKESMGYEAGKESGANREFIPDREFKTSWDMKCLYFTVREPYESKSTGAEIIFGRVSAEAPLVLTSQMPENGVIFSDGMESDFLGFHSGITARISVAEKFGNLVV